jgi:hypothetical protein
MGDSRAFGYIYSTENKKHMFYAIKTEKAVCIVIAPYKSNRKDKEFKL